MLVRLGRLSDYFDYESVWRFFDRSTMWSFRGYSENDLSGNGRRCALRKKEMKLSILNGTPIVLGWRIASAALYAVDMRCGLN